MINEQYIFSPYCQNFLPERPYIWFNQKYKIEIFKEIFFEDIPRDLDILMNWTVKSIAIQE